MASKPQSFRLPPDLYEAVTLRAKTLGFRTVTDYLKSLARYDLAVQGDHGLSKPWSDLPLAEQDKIDAHLLELTKSGKGERGQFLRHLLKEAGCSPEQLTTALVKGKKVAGTRAGE